MKQGRSPWIPLFTFLTLILATLACGSSWEATSVATSTPQPPIVTFTHSTNIPPPPDPATPEPRATAEPTATPSATPEPTSTPIPTATPTQEPSPTPAPSETPAQQPTDTPIPTPAPADTPVPQAQDAAKVIIRGIFYDGVVPRVESDEYAEIANEGGAPADIGGWRLNAGDPGQDFTFPSFVLQPGQACRVYTNESHPESCGFSFGSGRAIWNNEGACGYLYDAGGGLVAEYCY